MRYCPECQTITQEAASPTCPACGRVLLSMDELPPEERDRLVVLKWCANLEEAQVLKTALNAEGIDAMVEEQGLIAWVNPYDARGGATHTRVFIRLGDAEAGLELLRQKEAGELALSEDEIPEKADTEAKEDKEENPEPPA